MIRPISRRAFSAVTLTALACLAPAFAQDTFPSKPIKVIVPYPAGGNADNIARVFSNRMADIIGQPIIVEIKGGASGTIGAEAVHKADADGYTLLLTVTSQLTSPGPTVKTNYVATEDFTPVVGTQRSEFLPDVPTFAEQGYKDLDWTYSVAVYASSRMPAPILKKLQEAGKKFQADPQAQQAYRAQSNQPWTNSTPEELKRRLVDDSKNWARVYTQVGPLQ